MGTDSIPPQAAEKSRSSADTPSSRQRAEMAIEYAKRGREWRHLTASEQRIMDKALRRSVRIVSEERTSDE